MGISERQAGLFGGNPEWQKRIAAGAPAVRRTGPKTRQEREQQPENILEKQIGDFLHSRGWEVTRNRPGKFVPVGRLLGVLNKGGRLTHEVICSSGIITFAEPGIPDWTAVRPLRGPGIPFGAVQRFHYETKAPGNKPEKHQFEWMRRRAALGYSAAWFDGFEGEGPTKFAKWYRARFETTTGG